MTDTVNILEKDQVELKKKNDYSVKVNSDHRVKGNIRPKQNATIIGDFKKNTRKICSTKT